MLLTSASREEPVNERLTSETLRRTYGMSLAKVAGGLRLLAACGIVQADGDAYRVVYTDSDAWDYACHVVSAWYATTALAITPDTDVSAEAADRGGEQAVEIALFAAVRGSLAAAA
ncbi:MAG: hypothetical protein JWM93_2240 [Frankiales bacterium]|nr:hypothetical protein [Frankiales bacterium]